MNLMGEEYPPAKNDRALWKRWDRKAMSEASFTVVDKPQVDAGLDPEDFKLRLYFTRGANRYIKSQPSRGDAFRHCSLDAPCGSRGRMVDEFSSLELKKMLYLTKRRVRYLFYRQNSMTTPPGSKAVAFTSFPRTSNSGFSTRVTLLTSSIRSSKSIPHRRPSLLSSRELRKKWLPTKRRPWHRNPLQRKKMN